MNHDIDSKVGLLDDVTGDYFTAKLVSQPAGDTADGPINQEPVPLGQVGSYFSVRHSGMQTLVSVERKVL